ncbi:MAG: glycosyltransferase family 4 protein [Bacteroidota bacterium]|nr:glycosyltransferase family 4 protein [Bacteroidota bacterium]
MTAVLYKIAFITEQSPANKHSWSGTNHYVFEILKKKGHDVTALGPLTPRFLQIVFGILNQISLRLFKTRFDYRHSTVYSKAFGRLFTKKLKSIDHDIVVVCGGSEYAAYIKTSKPLFLIVDRVIAGTINYHSILSGLWKFSEEQSIHTDKTAMHKARAVFFSSPWAAEHAKKYYNLKSGQSVILPFGANLDSIVSRDLALKQKDFDECKLLLVGTYWKNKGADIAFNALKILLQKGVNVSLTIVGCIPPEPIQHEKLTILPFIDKNTSTGQDELAKLFLSHHLFILPTRFDCTPIVFCESSSFGVPILTSDTGGVRGHIKEGINGFTIPYEDKGDLFAEKIESIIKSPDDYTKLCISARNLYEQELNWEHWEKEFTSNVKRLIE